MADELALITAAVTGVVTGGVLKPVFAPVEALAELWKERVLARLERTNQAVARKNPAAQALADERVAYRALLEAAFTDDDVVREYLAGVIAGSTATDDAVTALALIGQLSSLQLRLHYVIYRELWRYAQLLEGTIAMTVGDFAAMSLFLPKSSLESAYEQPYDPLLARLLPAAEDLLAHGLLSDNAEGGVQVVGPHPNLHLRRPNQIVTKSRKGKKAWRDVPEPGLVVGTSGRGINLLLQGCGKSTDSWLKFAFMEEEELTFDPPVPPCRAIDVHAFPKTEPRPFSQGLD
jgi:hypothetical protein